MKKRYILLLTLLCTAALAIGALYFSGRHTNIISTATQHIPEQYTELFFNDYERLPKTGLVLGDSYPFSFTIKNNQASEQTYVYHIDKATVAGVQNLLTSQPITLKPGESSVQTATLVNDDPQRPILISISLQNRPQAIHFRVSE